VILKDTGNLGGAMRLHKEVEGICRRLNDLAGLGNTLGNPGVDPEGHRNLDGAVAAQEQEANLPQAQRPAGLQSSLGTRG